MNFRERLRENPWPLMIAINVAVAAGGLVHKLILPPFVPYIHLLVDYHFGFTKRALIGAVVGLLFSKVPVWLVFALGIAVLLVTFGLFIVLFRRTFGRDQLPLLVFVAGSPFFFKNFIYSLGHFDIYGCLLTITLLLIPARSTAFLASAVAASAVLIMIHHIHFLMYVPTIAVVVVLRYHLVKGFTPRNVTAGIMAAAAIVLLFLAVQFWGSLTISKSEFIQYLTSRMSDPSRTDLLSFSYIWYQPLSQEVRDTWHRLPHNALGLPVFALLIWLHTPLLRYFADLVKALSFDLHRRIVVAAIAGVSFGYLIIFAIVFDYSRWISNWAVCMFLIMHAVKMLPASSNVQFRAPSTDSKTPIFGWIVTLIPRVGIVRPI